MKYRYLKITGDLIWGKDEITREDLGGIKNRGVDAIVDTYQGTQFDIEKNEWVEIKGD